ncbi:flagellar basal body P-ring formation chaperone FlgA [Salaquimonas pukyongi]|uniref:flagellar basal body P-ring formation chaperone FlgA n=1 Tax=Salaquimonas pukyongi TaxID=2712698 RepID=UPI00096B7BE5|nr:flagellar basal body P-ring formation chaperone FlgA [Salaquimonas pukyongi]
MTVTGRRIINRFLPALVWLFLAAVSVRAAETVDIPVPNGVIYPGQQITTAMLMPRSVPLAYLGRVHVFAGHPGLVGKVARTTLLPNRPIQLNQVVEPNVVQANVPTIMRYEKGALLITAEVQPLNSAKAGELVRVRTRFSKMIVSGVAQPDGTISAGLQPASRQ